MQYVTGSKLPAKRLLRKILKYIATEEAKKSFHIHTDRQRPGGREAFLGTKELTKTPFSVFDYHSLVLTLERAGVDNDTSTGYIVYVS